MNGLSAMAYTNIHGLSRNIPESVKHAVRQRCGFGCIICGNSIVEYEHVDPEFAQAKRHDPDGITLLCPMCHARVTRKFLSKATVRVAMGNPRCKQQGFSFGELDPANVRPYIVFAGLTIINCPIPVQVRGLPLFQIESPEESGGPYRLSASFFDTVGMPSLLIRRNEWYAFSDAWDIEVSGGRIVIRSSPRNISLGISFVPFGGIFIEKVDMYVAGYRFLGNKETLSVINPGGGKIDLTRCICNGCGVGLALG